MTTAAQEREIAIGESFSAASRRIRAAGKRDGKSEAQISSEIARWAKRIRASEPGKGKVPIMAGRKKTRAARKPKRARKSRARKSRRVVRRAPVRRKARKPARRKARTTRRKARATRRRR